MFWDLECVGITEREEEYFISAGNDFKISITGGSPSQQTEDG